MRHFLKHTENGCNSIMDRCKWRAKVAAKAPFFRNLFDFSLKSPYKYTFKLQRYHGCYKTYAQGY